MLPILAEAETTRAVVLGEPGSRGGQHILASWQALRPTATFDAAVEPELAGLDFPQALSCLPEGSRPESSGTRHGDATPPWQRPRSAGDGAAVPAVQ